MNNARKVFLLTEEGRAPKVESQKEILDAIFENDKKTTHAKTYSGPAWLKPNLLADRLDGGSVVAVLVKDENGSYSCKAIRGNLFIAKLKQKLKATSDKDSYETALEFRT